MAIEKSASTGLSKDDSLVIKGVAILAMMWHHCFLNADRFSQFDLNLFPFTEKQVILIASYAKICVSLFVFVSGYGLFCSLRNEFSKNTPLSPSDLFRWYVTRYIRSFSDYWLIVLIACVVCQVLDGHTYDVFFDESIFTGTVYLALDFLGLSSLFGTPLLVGTWWYMSAAFAFILLAPLLYWAIVRFGGVACIGVVVVGVRSIGGYPGGRDYLSFLPAFIIGMVFANSDCVGRVKALAVSSRAKYARMIILLLIATAFCYKFNASFSTDKFWDVKWGLFVPVYVLLICLTIARIPFVGCFFRFLGDWSAEIFLIHTLIRSRYAQSLVYAPGYFLLVIVRLLAITLVVCLAFRLFKRVIRYDSLTAYLLNRVK